MTVEDCIKKIDEIRDNAASTQKKLQIRRDKLRQENPDDPQQWSWIESVIEFHQRLEALASSEKTTAQQAIELAEEADSFIKQNEVYFPFRAADLAQWIRERDKRNEKHK